MKFIILCSILLTSLLSQAQNFTSLWSDIEKHDPETEKLEMCGATNDYLYVVKMLKKKAKKLTILEYTLDLGVINAYTLEGPDEVFLTPVIVENRLVLLSQITRYEKRRVYGRFFQDGFFSDPVQLFESKHKSTKIIPVVSPDKKKLAFLGEAPLLKGSNEELEAWIFDKDLNLESEHLIAMSNPNLKRKVNVPVLNNLGDLYIVKRFKDAKGEDYYAYSVSNSQEGYKRKSLTLRGKNISDIEYTLDKNGMLHLAGLYKGNISGICEGSFYFKLDPTTRSLEFQQTQFEENFLLAAGGKEAVKKDNGIKRFKSEKMILLGEHVFLTITKHDWEHLEDKDVYRKDKLAVICMNNQGNTIWAKSGDIIQESENDRGHLNQHYLVENNGGVAVVYNELSLKTSEIGVQGISFTLDGTEKKTNLSRIANSSSEPLILDWNTACIVNKEIILLGWTRDKTGLAVGSLLK